MGKRKGGGNLVDPHHGVVLIDDMPEPLKLHYAAVPHKRTGVERLIHLTGPRIWRLGITLHSCQCCRKPPVFTFASFSVSRGSSPSVAPALVLP